MINYKVKLTKYNTKLKHIGGASPGGGSSNETPDEILQRLSNLSRPPTAEEVQLLDNTADNIRNSEEYQRANDEYQKAIELTSGTPDSDPRKAEYRAARDRAYKIYNSFNKKIEDIITLHSILEANLQSNSVPMSQEQLQNQQQEYERQQQEHDRQREEAARQEAARQAEN